MAMIDEPINIIDEDFEKIVMQSNIPVIVDFWAPWCGPCRKISPILDNLAKKYTGKLLVVKVNVDEDVELVNKFEIQSIPTLLFITEGKIVHRQEYALSESMLKEAVSQFLNTVSN